MALVRGDSASAGAVGSKKGSVEIIEYDNGLVTAVRDSGGDLKLITWTVDRGGGNITRRDSESAGQVNQIAMATGTYFVTQVVTAVRDSNDNLKMIAWRIGASDEAPITRIADASAGTVSDIAITETTFQGLFSGYTTAVIDSAGNLKLIHWNVDIGPGGFVNRRSGDLAAGAVSEVSIATIRHIADGFQPRRVVTAVRDSEDNLKVIVWQVSGSEGRLGDDVAGEADLINVTRLRRDRICVACRDSEGNLKIIVWDIDDEGQPIRRGDASAGAVSRISITSSWHGLATTAVRDASGDLKVIQWNIDNDGNVTRGDDVQAGEIGLVSIARSDSAYMTAVRDSDGDLKLIEWK